MKKTIFTAAVFGVLAQVPAQAEVTTQVYGFAKASYMYTSRQFAQDQKPISVVSDNGLTGTAKDLNASSRGQFSARHSRFGLNVDNGSKAKAKMEFDFDGQGEATGGNTVGVASSELGTFRVRQANISIKTSDAGTITLGKKWEIFSPVGPHSYQMTTIQFWAGNTGFITDGIDYTHKLENASFAVELKNATTNVNAVQNATTANNIKLSAPVATVRADYKVAEDQLLGLSAEAGKIAYEKQDATHKDPSLSGINVYYTGKFGAFELVGEVYQGKNLGLGVTGALAQPTNAGSAADAKNEEMGYYLSGKYAFENSSIYGGYGEAKLTDDKDTANSFRNIASNAFTRLGYDYTVDAGVTFYAEASLLSTGFNEGGSVNKYAGTFVDVGLIAKF